jgi:hypothetical protein
VTDVTIEPKRTPTTRERLLSSAATITTDTVKAVEDKTGTDDVAIEPKRGGGRRPRPLSKEALAKLVRKKPRKRYRGVPPPLPFDIDALPDSTLLTEGEVAAVVRRSRTTLETWRRFSEHPLQWRRVAGRVLYEIGPVRKFLKGDTDKRKVVTEK